jgi:uncharacterized membrane protein YbhN (UPF0104 family)
VNLGAVFERQSIRRLASALLATAVFFFVGSLIWRNWQEIREADFELRPGLLVLSIVLLGCYFVGRSLLWNFLTTRAGVAIGYRDAIAAWFYSQLGKYLPGKVFLYLGRLHYYRRQGRSTAQVSMVFIIETLATLSASIVTVLVSLLVLDVAEIEEWRYLLAVALVGLGVSLHPRFLNGTLGVVLRIFKRAPQRIELAAADTYLFVALYVVNWLVFGVAFYVFITAIVPISASYIIYLAGSFSLASLVGMFSVFVPSGLGVREGILIFMLSQVIPLEAAIVVSVAARLWFTAVELLAIGAVRMATGSPISWSASSEDADGDGFSTQPSGSKGSL